MLDYGEMKNNLLVYKSKEQIADICIAHYKEIERLKEKLKFEETTNKELLSTGAELEKKLYEEQDKNKRLKKELQEEIEEKEHYQAIVESWE